MNEPLNEEKNEHDPIIENELKKIKLSLEHGMDFSQSFVSPITPPEIEGEFLNYIQQWEDQYAQRKMISVYDRAGRPSFRPVGEIPDEEIAVALDEAMTLLNKHSVYLETLCKVQDRELYRFVTEELLTVEMNDIRIEGMKHCFTYEEFHPNHPYDIKNRCTELIRHLAADEGTMDLIPWGLADQVTFRGEVYKKDELNDRMIRFRKSFSSLTLFEFDYLSVTLSQTEDEAMAEAVVHYSGVTDRGETVELSGNCTFNLKCEYGWWLIHQLETPCHIIV